MLILIDESGDAGFKVAKGSTPHFVVAMAVFRDLNEAEAASRAIAEARERLRMKPEFKFSKCSAAVRDGFFEAVRPYRFAVRALVVDKARIYSPDLRASADRFYSYFVRLLLRHDADLLAGARVKIDGRASPDLRRDLAKALREGQSVLRMANVKFSDSHRDNLIQLADMAAGAIARSYRQDDRKEANRWRSMLADKLEEVWEFKG
jgi:hypothetical protein